NMALHVSLDQRKVAELPDDVTGRLVQMKASHAKLPVPEAAARRAPTAPHARSAGDPFLPPPPPRTRSGPLRPPGAPAPPAAWCGADRGSILVWSTSTGGSRVCSAPFQRQRHTRPSLWTTLRCARDTNVEWYLHSAAPSSNGDTNAILSGTESGNWRFGTSHE